MTTTVKYGDSVLYVPHSGHWNDRDAKGNHLFDFVYDHPALGEQAAHPKHGQPVEPEVLKEAHPKVVADLAGKPQLALGERGIVIKPGQPREHWKATVVGIHPDGTASLLIQHPDPGQGTRHGGVYENVVVVENAEAVNGKLHVCYPAPKEEDSPPPAAPG